MKIFGLRTYVLLLMAATSMAVGVNNAHAVVDDPHLSVEAAASNNAVFQFDSLTKLTTKAKTLEKVGMRLTDIEVQRDSSGKLVFGGVWKPGTGKYMIVRNTSWTQFTAKWDELSRAGYRLLDVDRIYEGSSLVHYSVYGEGNHAYVMYADYWAGFEAHWKKMSAEGMRLMDVDVVNISGNLHYLGIYRPGTDAYGFYSTSSIQEFIGMDSNFQKQGLDLIDVNMVLNSNGTTQYVGVWLKGKAQGRLKLHAGWASFKKGWAEQAKEGYALLDVDFGNSNAFIASYGPYLTKPVSNPDLNRMAAFLETRYTNNVNGMSYAISQNGQLAIAGATGFAQRYPDPTVEMSSNSRSIIASVTKMLTAPLLYNLLSANGLTLDSPVHPWLPTDWTRGPGFNATSAAPITFGHLLRHTSGLGQVGSSLTGTDRERWATHWEGLRFVVQRGASPATAQYENMNYALMRVLIPRLWSQVGGPTGSIDGVTSGLRYLDFMNHLVTGNEDIKSISCSAQSSFPESRMYKLNDFNLSGWRWMARADDCGGFAQLHLSAKEMTQYWTSVRFNDDIMNDTNRALMRNRAGMWNAYTVDGGTAYGHSGGWYWNDRTTETCLLEFPNNVVASIILNSGRETGIAGGCSSLVSAFNDSI